MKITCPHCHHHVEVVGLDEELHTRCPACGSDLSMELRTSSYRPRPATLLHGFELLECVGAGQFGEVWRAKDRKLDRLVAVKLPRTHLLDHEAFHTFVREAQAAAQLRHPNIVAVYDVLREDDRVFMVSEFIDGVSLAEFTQEYRFSQREAAELAATLADALHHAHDAGVVHRDLKPSNIILDGKRVPHITDFGLAKREGDEITLSVEGKVLGTPAYMSPEQAGGRGHDADRRSDVYSLGVILYELLLGKRPFTGRSRMLIHQILHEEPPALRKQDAKVPRDLETICLKALAKSPQERYARMADFAADLRRFLRGEPIVARPANSWERVWRWCRRNPAWTTAVASAVALLLALVAVFAQGQRAGADAAAWEREKESLQDDIRMSDERRERVEQQLPPQLPPQRVRISTEPPGADLVFYQLSPLDGRVDFDHVFRFAGQMENHLELPPGNYLVVAHLPNGDFQEVFRRIPNSRRDLPGRHAHYFFAFLQPDEATLPPIRIRPTAEVTREMVLVQGHQRVQIPGSEQQTAFRLPDFFLDPTEVDVATFRRFVPSSDSLQRRQQPEDFPMTDLSFDEVIVYAESCGKIPATDLMFHYASTGGNVPFPWGDAGPAKLEWKLGPVGQRSYDTRASEPRLLGLFSNALEWTLGPFPAFGRQSQTLSYDLKSTTVCGGPESALSAQVQPADWQRGAAISFDYLILKSHPLIGFRCARSVRPRLAPADFAEILPTDAVATARLGPEHRLNLSTMSGRGAR